MWHVWKKVAVHKLFFVPKAQRERKLKRSGRVILKLMF
jgi:hypothetical protein